MKKTTSFITACEVLGIPPSIPEVSGLPQNYQKQTVDFYKMNVIADAINKEADWTPDYNDSDQRKYFPIFYFDASASGWVFNVYDLWTSRSHVGSQLCFSTYNECEYAAEIFLKEGLSI